MRFKKLTQQQRIGRLEKVVSQTWALAKMLEIEVKKLQDESKSSEEEE